MMKMNVLVLNACTNTPIFKRVINNSTIEVFKSYIERCNWNTVIQCTDTDSAYRHLFSAFNKLYDEHIPLKKIEHNKKAPKQLWITNGLLNSIKTKNYRK